MIEEMSFGEQEEVAPKVENRCLFANDNTFLLMAFGTSLSNMFDRVDKVTDGK